MSLASTDARAVYINAEQSWFSDRVMSFVVRSRSNPAALSGAAREAVWSIDKDQPVARAATMTSLVEASASERGFALIVFEGFALASLALAAIGIYGLLAGGVAERTREIGVRAALGATRGEIVALVARQGVALTAAGVVTGLGAAAVASRGLTTPAVRRHPPRSADLWLGRRTPRRRRAPRVRRPRLARGARGSRHHPPRRMTKGAVREPPVRA